MVDEGFRIYKLYNSKLGMEFTIKTEMLLNKSELETINDLVKDYWIVLKALEMFGIREIKVRPLDSFAEFKRIYP